MDIQFKAPDIIKEIIVRVIQSNELPDSGSLIEYLLAKGYQLKDINIALELLLTLPEIITPGESFKKHLRNAQVQRIFSEAEKYKLSLDAQGFFYSSVQAGLLTTDEIETIMNVALQMNVSEVGVAELKWIINNVVSDMGRLLLINAMQVESPANKDRKLVN